MEKNRKHINAWAVSFVLLGGLAACEEDISGFDVSKNFIYFDVPYKLNDYGNPTSERTDSLTYSFALDDASVHSAIIKVPVSISGMVQDVDRAYQVSVDKAATTATDAEWDVSTLSPTIIRAGSLTDTMYIKVYRSEAMTKQWKNIVLTIVPNEEFAAGYGNLQSVKLSMSDQLPEPSWWKTWQSRLGTFSREVYIKWMEIYYEGADTKTDSQGRPYYWDNMPTYAMESWYPTTFMYIRILKQYFIDHVVYINGDPAQGRVTLP